MSDDAVVYEVNGQLVLEDPTALQVIKAVDKYNCQATLAVNKGRVAYFVQRIAERGRNAADTVIVLLNVDDPNGGALADVLMPGYPWGDIRERGEVPYARGLAEREGIQAALDEIDADAAMRLRGMSEIAVVVLDYGVAEVFAVEATGV